MIALARLISLLFHPLLIMTYMLVLLLMVNPYLFGLSSLSEKPGQMLLLQVFFSTFFIPAFAMLMLRFLGLVPSLRFRERTDRIIPYIITGVFYLWMFYNFLNNSQVPDAYASFALGATIGLFLAFFINIFSKISAHTVGMGVFIGMVVITMFLFSYGYFTVDLRSLGSWRLNMILILLVTLLIAGLVGTARQMLEWHEPIDLYGGYLIGFAAQVIAFRFIF
jgi:hypothetical protein